MSVGVTGVNIAPEIGLHFHEGSLSFVEKICCCAGCAKEPELPKLNEQMYIDRKMRLRRWKDAKCEPSMAATHARLKLMVIERFESVSDSPYIDAKTAFDRAGIEWINPMPLHRVELEKLNVAVSEIRDSIINMP